MLSERSIVLSIALATLIGVSACATPSTWKADTPAKTKASVKIPAANTGVFTEEPTAVAPPTGQATEAFVETPPAQGEGAIEEVTVVGKSLPNLPVDICGLLEYADSGFQEGSTPRNEWSFYVGRTAEKTTTICTNKPGKCECKEESSDVADLGWFVRLFKTLKRAGLWE